MHQIAVTHEPVELYKILKFECLVDGGGEAKIAIVEGWVSVNNQVVTQKRKKIYAGDIIHFNGETYQIVLAPDAEPTSAVRQNVTTAKAIEVTAPTAMALKSKTKKRSAIKF